jgi:hypothetical protein
VRIIEIRFGNGIAIAIESRDLRKPIPMVIPMPLDSNRSRRRLHSHRIIQSLPKSIKSAESFYKQKGSPLSAINWPKTQPEDESGDGEREMPVISNI